jgi:hypothetical protein
MGATCLRSASSGYHAEFIEGYQKLNNPLNCRNNSSDISCYRADFHEGHGTVGKWQGRGMACVNQRGTAWARHCMCELALKFTTEWYELRQFPWSLVTCCHDYITYLIANSN